MRSNIFIPQKINVGFQERKDTYTKKLAYVIYFDEKGVLRKEKSWNGWRNKDIENIIYDNVPTSGFVLNKKVGDYVSDWNHRQAYVRVYDPRNYEFEITVENLLYILENASSIKGKGLEGEFVLGWNSKELILIPVDSPDYKELSKLNDLRYECKKYEGKNLIIGATYKDTNNHNLAYLGRFYESNDDNKESKAYFFYNLGECYSKIVTIKSLNKTIIDIIDDKCIDNYSFLFDELQKSSYYSEREPKKDKYVDYTFEEFESRLTKDYYWGHKFFNQDENNEIQKLIVKENRNYGYSYNRTKSYNVYTSNRGNCDEQLWTEKTLMKVFEEYKPKYLVSYKSNGEIIKEWKI